MKKGKKIVISGIVIVLGLMIFGGISTGYLSPVSTTAQQSQQDVFAAINQKAKENKQSPSFAKSEELAGLLIQGLSVFELPEELQTPIKQQMATASLNGSSMIDENNIAIAVNNLADQAGAPNYAYTNFEQVKVVRKFLNRLIPEVVSGSGQMTDMEAFAVFVSTLSQKTDNDAFMVTPAEFTASMGASNSEPLPGSSAANASNVPEALPESVKANQMLGVIEGYLGSKRRLTSNNIISTIGIQ